MKKIAIKILSAHKIYAKEKIEDLQEKQLVPSMMLRRRLTRNSKVMLYLSHKCNFEGGKVVYGTCFGEVEESTKMANSVIKDGTLSPTSFQNSVYNTAPSYYSLVKKDTDEIITISSGKKTSLDTLKTAALQALVSKEKVFCVAVECINIPNIDEVNRCTIYLEAGVGCVVEVCENDEAKEIQECAPKGVIDSLKDMMSVAQMFENGDDKIWIEL